MRSSIVLIYVSIVSYVYYYVFRHSMSEFSWEHFHVIFSRPSCVIILFYYFSRSVYYGRIEHPRSVETHRQRIWISSYVSFRNVVSIRIKSKIHWRSWSIDYSDVQSKIMSIRFSWSSHSSWIRIGSSPKIDSSIIDVGSIPYGLIINRWFVYVVITYETSCRLWWEVRILTRYSRSYDRSYERYFNIVRF